VTSVEAGRTGAFNVGGKPGLTIGEVLEACRRAGRVPGASFVWASEAFLLQQGVTPWTELPLWVRRDRDDLAGLDSTKTQGAGLRLRPLAQTVSDTLEWDRTRPKDLELRAGLSDAREADLLQRWRAAH